MIPGLVHAARDCSYLSAEQVALLLKPIHPQRVLTRDGMSYVEGYDVRAELNRVFGFGRWSQEILRQDVVCEEQKQTRGGRDAWYVVYRTMMRLTVCAPDGHEITRYEGSHVGESTHPVRGEAHGNAVTNSETYALRRCAINLGDQFGLSLYNKGSLEAIVRWTLVRPDEAPADTDDVVQVEQEAEENPGSISDAEPVASPQRTRAKAQPKTKAEPLTTAKLAVLIADATTVEELRALWKQAGAAGLLPAVVEDGQGGTVQERLGQRSDELAFPKSAEGADQAGDAGAGLAGE